MLNAVKHLYRFIEQLGGSGRDASLRGRQISMTRFTLFLTTKNNALYLKNDPILPSTALSVILGLVRSGRPKVT
jgi:hypothetical protein